MEPEDIFKEAIETLTVQIDRLERRMRDINLEITLLAQEWETSDSLQTSYIAAKEVLMKGPK